MCPIAVDELLLMQRFMLFPQILQETVKLLYKLLDLCVLASCPHTFELLFCSVLRDNHILTETHTLSCTHAHRHDSICYVPCSGNDRLLYNFTSAGVGVPPSWIAARPSLEVLPYCLWVIAPLVERTNSSSGEYEESLLLPSHANSSILNFKNSSLRISLEFKSDQTSQCYDETVLIYTGLPDFLNSSLTHFELNKTGALLGMFTGDQLVNHSISVLSPVVTVVYYTSTRPASQVRGFNLTVRTDLQLGEDGGWPLNGSSEQVSL